MTWPDIDWANDRIKITSPKTARHPGHAHRWLPLFPELRPLLQEAFDAAPDGAVNVLDHPRWRMRGSALNLRQTMLRWIEAAGLTPWPKLWVNLRATRAVELRQMGFPDHVCNAWLGHTSGVAAEHYLRVTEADFKRAVGGLEQAAQKAAQSARAADCTEVQRERESVKNPREKEHLQASTPTCTNLQGGGAGRGRIRTYVG